MIHTSAQTSKLQIFTIAIIALLLTNLSCKKGSSDNARGSTQPPAEETAPGAIAIDTDDEKKAAAPKTGIQKDFEKDLSSSLVKVDPKIIEKIPLRPAMMVGTVALSLFSEPTDLTRFEENRYVWNPAQVPLEELNKLVCVLANSGFHIFPNQGRYKAKIKISDCFSSSGTTADGVAGGANVAKPVDVVVETKTLSNKDIQVKIWFTREIDSGDTEAITWKAFDKIEMDYYVNSTITKTPDADNPFGIFDMKWEMLAAIDGEVDTRPYQQGYVTTGISPSNANMITLDYNQKNWVYERHMCPAGDYTNYQGFVFNTASEDNDFNLEFDSTASRTIQEVINAVTISVSVFAGEDVILPEGVATFSGGIDKSYSTATYNGIAFSSLMESDFDIFVVAGETVRDVINNSINNQNISVTADTLLDQQLPVGTINFTGGSSATNATATLFQMNFDVGFGNNSQLNGKDLTFDGTDTLKTVLDNFYDLYGYKVTFNGVPWDAILPTASVTVGGGTSVANATITVPTNIGNITLQSKDGMQDPAKLNGLKLRFDGISTVDELVDSHPESTNLEVIGDGSFIPVAGTYVLANGVSPLSDEYGYINEFSAVAEMSLKSGKPIRGKAHTSRKNYEEKLSTNCPSMHSWTPEPLSYGMAFDRYDTYPGKIPPASPADHVDYPGRSALKQFSDFVDATNAGAAFDPNAMRCEQIGGELASVWQWAIFDNAGKRIEYKTDAPLYLENTTNAWGDGWVSQWGINLWSPVESGDKAYIKKSDGTKRMFTIQKFSGNLVDENWMSLNTKINTGEVSYKCSDRCPSGTLTQQQIDNQYDSVNFLFEQEYIYDYVAKKLYRDIDKDGGKDFEIKLDSGVSGWFELHLALKSDDTQKFKYIFDSWSNIIGLKEGGTYYVSPKKINFDVTQVYDNEADAYIGSESFNSHHDGKAFSELIDGTELSFEYGGICCFKWEKKYGFKDEWGGNASAPSITLRKGTTLTVDTSVGGDPDGSGPIVDGMKIKVAPIFTELRPQTKEDCSVELTTSVSDIKDSMSLPEPLPDSTDREISVIIGEEPSGAHPVLIREGERI